jgi:hypothetical protein
MRRNSRKATRERDHRDLGAGELLGLDKQATLQVYDIHVPQGTKGPNFTLAAVVPNNQKSGQSVNLSRIG